MAWTYFTANLAEGDLITEAQRNELYDAFLERAGAVQRFLSDTYEVSSDLRDSLFATDLVERDGDTPVRLAAALAALSAYYVRPEKVAGYPDADESDVFVFNGSTTENAFYMAATDLGYATDLFADEHFHSWKKWNVLRAVIQLLKYPLIATAGNGLQAPTRYGRSASDYPWADAKAAFLAAGESSPGGSAPADLYMFTNDVSPTYIEITGKRATYALEIPDIEPFSQGYQLVGWFNRLSGGGYVNHAITLEFDGGTKNVATLPAEEELVCAEASADERGTTGAVDLEAYLDGYFDDAALDEMEPPTEDVLEAGASVFQVAAIPTFTHP
jgi:hypothetical protein